jgi:hypothetical protein
MNLIRFPIALVALAALLPTPAGASAPAAAGATSGETSPHQHASSPQRASQASPIAIRIDAATLATIPRQTVDATVRGSTVHCDGVAVADLLRASGALTEEPLHGAGLANYVLVTGRDGHRVLYSLAELDPSLGRPAVLLVDRCEGRMLDAASGPLRLIAPGDSRHGRWVKQVHSITVVGAP